jgi:hypothetical protein
MKFIECELKYGDSKRIKEALLLQAENDAIFKEKLENWEVEEMAMIELLAHEAYNQTEKTKIGGAQCPLGFGIEEQIAHIIHCVDENITKPETKVASRVETKVVDSANNEVVEEDDSEEDSEETKEQEQEVKQPFAIETFTKKKKNKKNNNQEQLSLF